MACDFTGKSQAERVCLKTLSFFPHPVEHFCKRIVSRYCDRESFNNLYGWRSSEDPNSYSPLPLLRHDCIFVHIPKCAGISLCTQLFNARGPGHVTIRDYEIAMSVREFRSSFKFAIVRNPWERVVSAFHFLKKGGMNERDRNWADENIAEFATFDEFVRNWLSPENVANLNNLHFLPATHFLKTSCGKIPLDFIGRMETLDEAIDEICHRLDLPVISLKKRNQSQHVDYRTLYTRSSRAIIEKCYEEDIDFFNYRFE